jgi:hypothetical protein
MNRNFLPRLAGALLLLCCSSFYTMAQTTPDPGLMGPHAVLKAEYNLGNSSYVPPPAAMFSHNMEEIGSVHYPADLSSGPFPVLVWLHGRHETCYDSVSKVSSSSWPCTGRNKPIPSYEGYDYAATTMASHGYIVISISANCINAFDGPLPDAGMNARGVLTQHHLDLWNKWNTTGGAPFDTTFIGKLDMKNIGTMGHSRGGEGVIYQAIYNKTLGSPYGIKAILTLAPVDFYRKFVNNIPLLDIAPYCDGDVSDLEGLHFYDDVRYNVATDQAPKHTILFLGANHNFFNTVWSPNPYIGGGADDWGDYGWSNLDPQCGISKASRFDTVKERNAYNTYAAAFYRLYLGHEAQFAPILEVSDIVPPASSTLDTTNVFVSYHPGAADRIDVNRTDKLSTYTTNTLSGTATESGLVSSEICGGGLGMPDCALSTNPAQEPHNGDASTIGLAQMGMQWNSSTDFYQNDIPQASENMSRYQYLMFRASVNYALTAPGPNLNYTVQLIDSAGNIGSQQVGSHTHAMFYEPGTEPTDLPKTVMNTVNLPLNGFTGVDLSKVRHIKFLFDKSTAGAILISDLTVTHPICDSLVTSMKDSIGKLNKVIFTTTGTTSTDDTLVYYWNFGDPASGLKDTSTSPNPTHTYTLGGTYHPCVYITVKKKAFCTDTHCITITLPNVGVEELARADDAITIIPNPAKDYLQINGAEKTDVLRLINLYGQVVFTATLNETVVHLPQVLAAGVYYAIVTTGKGNVYKKIVINR